MISSGIRSCSRVLRAGAVLRGCGAGKSRGIVSSTGAWVFQKRGIATWNGVVSNSFARSAFGGLNHSRGFYASRICGADDSEIDKLLKPSEQTREEILNRYKEKLQKKTKKEIENVEDVEAYLKEESIEITEEAEHQISSYFEKKQPGSQLPRHVIEQNKEVLEKAEKKMEKKNPDVGKTKDPSKITPIKPGEDKLPVGARKLDDIMKVDLCEPLDADAISKLWNYHHQQSGVDVLSASIPGDVYRKFKEKFRDCPRFVYLLPRPSGYETIYAEFQGQVCLFTPLLEYKTKQDFASSVMTMTHFTELLESKDVVLMRSEYEKDKLTPMEAQYLANQVQLHYISSDAKFEHVYNFNHHPEKFDFDKLVKEMETLA